MPPPRQPQDLGRISALLADGGFQPSEPHGLEESGKKIQVPFDQLIIFSTNLDPKELVDEAFLRRIPYKIFVPDPDEAEFHQLFQRFSVSLGCPYDQEAVEYLLAMHYRPVNRPLRRCHPRDLALQIRNSCAYTGRNLAMKAEYFDQAVETYFTVEN